MNVVTSGMPSNKPLTTLIIEPDLIIEIEDFRFANRFQSRAAAMKWLMRAALKAGLTPGPDDLRYTPRGESDA